MADDFDPDAFLQTYGGTTVDDAPAPTADPFADRFAPLEARLNAALARGEHPDQISEQAAPESQAAFPNGARVTSYGYSSDPYRDSASLGTGKYRFPTGAWDNPLSESSFSASPDIERQLASIGVNPKQPARIVFDDGSSVVKTWDDRTRQDLTGRLDFYSPSGIHPLEGKRVVAIQRADSPAIGAWQSPTAMPQPAAQQPAFDPDAFLAANATKPAAFDPDAFIAEHQPEKSETPAPSGGVTAFLNGGAAPNEPPPEGFASWEAYRDAYNKQVQKPTAPDSGLAAAGSLLGEPEIANPEGANEAVSKTFQQPYFEIPKPEASGIGSGVARGTLDMLEGLETPQNATIGAASTMVPAPVQRLIGLGFGAQMMRAAPDEVAAALAAKTSGEAAQHWTRAVLSFLGGGLTAGASGGARPGEGGTGTTPRVGDVDISAKPTGQEQGVTPPNENTPTPQQPGSAPAPQAEAGGASAPNSAPAGAPVSEPVKATETPPIEPTPAPTNEPPTIPTPAPVEGNGTTEALPPVDNNPKPAEPPPIQPNSKPLGVEPTSIKNAATDIDRTALALQPAEAAEREPWNEVNAKAEAALAQNPAAGEQLASKLDTSPRVVTPEESAILAREWAKRKAVLKAANDAVNTAYDAGAQDELPSLLENRQAAEESAQKLADTLRQVGTKAGQALAARKMFEVSQYELPEMLAATRAKKGGVPLTQAETAEVRLRHQKIQDLMQKVEEHEQAKADTAATATLDQISKESAKGSEQTRRTVIRKVSDTLKSAAEQARERLRQKRENPGALSGPGDLTDIDDYIIIGASHIAEGAARLEEFTARMVKEFGEAIKPHLANIFTAAKKRVFDEIKSVQALAPKDVAEKIKARLSEGSELKQLKPYVRKLAEALINSGVGKREELVDRIHAELEKAAPGTTRRDAVNLLSGYGDVKPPPTDAAKVQLAQWNRELQLVRQIEDMQEGNPPLKSGPQRVKPSDEARRLEKLKAELKKSGGFEQTDPATQLKSALDAVKTRLKNQLRDYAEQIDLGRKTNGKTPLEYDSETEKLKALRDRVKSTLEEISGKPEMTDEQRVKAATKALGDQVAELEQRLKTEDVHPQRGNGTSPWSQEIAALRNRKVALQAQMDELRALSDAVDGTAEQRRLAAFKARTLAKMAELRERIAQNNFAPKAKRTPVALDAEGERLKAALKAETNSFRQFQEKLRLANRTKFEKTVDALSGYSRGGKLTRIKTLAKLAIFSVQELALKPMDEAAGAVLSKLAPELSRKANIEGGGSLSALGGFYKGIIYGLKKDAMQPLRQALAIVSRGRLGDIAAQSELKALYASEKVHVDPRWWDIPQLIHEAEKSPLKRASFEYATRKLERSYTAQGKDISNPGVREEIRKAAYEFADRTILMSKNRWADVINSGIGRLEQVDSNTGKVPVAGKIGAGVARSLFTFNRVQSNHAVQLFNRVLGLPVGMARYSVALARGLENLHPDEANSIVRQMKQGTPGAAMLTYGMMNAQNFGGIDPRRKHKDGELGFGEINIGGHKIPRVVSLAVPLLMTAQLGATMTHVAKDKVKGQEKGTAAGLAAGAAGLAESGPMVNEAARMDQLLDPNQRGKFVTDWLTSNLVPGILDEAARELDTRNGQTVTRKPATVGDYLKQEIPGMRQQVPEYHPKR